MPETAPPEDARRRPITRAASLHIPSAHNNLIAETLIVTVQVEPVLLDVIDVAVDVGSLRTRRAPVAIREILVQSIAIARKVMFFVAEIAAIVSGGAVAICTRLMTAAASVIGHRGGRQRNHHQRTRDQVLANSFMTHLLFDASNP